VILFHFWLFACNSAVTMASPGGVRWSYMDCSCSAVDSVGGMLRGVRCAITFYVRHQPLSERRRGSETE